MRAVYASAWVLAGLFLLAPPSLAATITFDLNFEFSGADEPEGAAPWISATFDDSFGGTDTVRLTMTTANLTDDEFISEWSFNFNPLLDPTLLSFSYIDTVFDDINDGQTDTNTGVNAFMADGDGKFDIQFDFPPPPGNEASKFTMGETVVYDITYSGGNIDVGSFNFMSEEGGGGGTYFAAAHIQGIGAGDDGSGWIGAPVPEPTTVSLLALGLIGLAVQRRR